MTLVVSVIGVTLVIFELLGFLGDSDTQAPPVLLVRHISTCVHCKSDTLDFGIHLSDESIVAVKVFDSFSQFFKSFGAFTVLGCEAHVSRFGFLRASGDCDCADKCN